MKLTDRARSTGAQMTEALEGAGGTATRTLGPVLRWWDEVGSPLAMPTLRRVWFVLSIPTWIGWSLLVSGAVGIYAGSTWGWREASVIGIIALAVVALSTPYLIGRTDYEARLDLNRSRVVAGERAVGAIQLRNPRSRALLPVRVELPVGQSTAVFDIPRIGPGEDYEDLFTIPTRRRAVLKVGPIRAVRGDPIGVLAKVATWTEPQDLYVHPKTVMLEGSSAGFLQDLEGLPTRDLSSADVSFHALREYAPGDDRRYVHWKSSARTGKLMVRQFEETRRSHLAVGLSSSTKEYKTEDEFELAVSCAGSLGLQAIREGKQVSIHVPSGVLPTRTGRMLLDGLSGVEQTAPRRGDLVELGQDLSQHAAGASVAVLVTGSLTSPAQVRRATTSIPLGVQVIALVCEDGGALSHRMIGDIAVLTISQLPDLPRALRRL